MRPGSGEVDDAGDGDGDGVGGVRSDDADDAEGFTSRATSVLRGWSESLTEDQAREVAAGIAAATLRNPGVTAIVRVASALAPRVGEPPACRETFAAVRAAWGDRTVSVTFSPDELYQRGVAHPTHGRALLAAHEETRTFGAFLDLAATHGDADYVSVSQCEQALADFGLPAAPPIIAEQLGLDPTTTRSNLWATPAPKVSVLHHDTDDSMLLQFSGTKRFTVVAPCAHGMGVAPCVQRVERRRRVAPGVYEPEASDDARQCVVTAAHVDGLEAEEDPDGWGRAQQGATRSRSRARVASRKWSSTSTSTSSTRRM